MNNNVKKDVGLHTKYSSIEKKDVTASETINGAIQEITQMKCTENIQEEAEESLKELLEKLNSLIGLEGVKEEVNQIISLIRLQKKGEELGGKGDSFITSFAFLRKSRNWKNYSSKINCKDI